MRPPSAKAYGFAWFAGEDWNCYARGAPRVPDKHCAADVKVMGGRGSARGVQRTS